MFVYFFIAFSDEAIAGIKAVFNKWTAHRQNITDKKAEAAKAQAEWEKKRKEPRRKGEPAPQPPTQISIPKLFSIELAAELFAEFLIPFTRKFLRRT